MIHSAHWRDNRLVCRDSLVIHICHQNATLFAVVYYIFFISSVRLCFFLLMIGCYLLFDHIAFTIFMISSFECQSKTLFTINSNDWCCAAVLLFLYMFIFAFRLGAKMKTLRLFCWCAIQLLFYTVFTRTVLRLK